MSSPDPFSMTLQSRIQRAREEGRYRILPRIDGLIDFCSNDYLGLARDPVPEMVVAEHSLVPSGATGSRLISGNDLFFEEVEQQIAAFHGAGSALIFSSGYQANISLLSSLPRRHDTIIYDQLIHASLRDGIRLSGANSFSFRHNDLDDLKNKIALGGGAKLIVVESIYSMDGDHAPLAGIVDLAEEVGAGVVVDEAHSVGIEGVDGRGLVSELGLERRVLARTVTFGKALGCHGAAIVGDEVLREFLINFARGFIYTTAMSPRALMDIRQAYRMLPLVEPRREKLRELSLYMCSVLSDGRTNSWSPIHQIVVPGNDQVLRMAAALREAGLGVVAIRSPTVPAGSERIRVCLHSYNSKSQIDRLVECVRRHQENPRESAV